MATLLQRTGLRLVCPGWDVHLRTEGRLPVTSGHRRALGASCPSRPTLTCRTTPTTGRFRVCPGTGAGHWSISLHTVGAGGGRQEPQPQPQLLTRPLWWPLTCFQAGCQLVEVLRGHQAQQCLEQPDEGQAGHQHQRLQGPQGRRGVTQPPRSRQGPLRPGSSRAHPATQDNCAQDGPTQTSGPQRHRGGLGPGCQRGMLMARTSGMTSQRSGSFCFESLSSRLKLSNPGRVTRPPLASSEKQGCPGPKTQRPWVPCWARKGQWDPHTGAGGAAARAGCSGSPTTCPLPRSGGPRGPGSVPPWDQVAAGGVLLGAQDPSPSAPPPWPPQRDQVAHLLEVAPLHGAVLHLPEVHVAEVVRRLPLEEAGSPAAPTLPVPPPPPPRLPALPGCGVLGSSLGISSPGSTSRPSGGWPGAGSPRGLEGSRRPLHTQPHPAACLRGTQERQGPWAVPRRAGPTLRRLGLASASPAAPACPPRSPAGPRGPRCHSARRRWARGSSALRTDGFGS